jgi:hypothetical protein
LYIDIEMEKQCGGIEQDHARWDLNDDAKFPYDKPDPLPIFALV